MTQTFLNKDQQNEVEDQEVQYQNFDFDYEITDDEELENFEEEEEEEEEVALDRSSFVFDSNYDVWFTLGAFILFSIVFLLRWVEYGTFILDSTTNQALQYLELKTTAEIVEIRNVTLELDDTKLDSYRQLIQGTAQFVNLYFFMEIFFTLIVFLGTLLLSRYTSERIYNQRNALFNTVSILLATLSTLSIQLIFTMCHYLACIQFTKYTTQRQITEMYSSALTFAMEQILKNKEDHGDQVLHSFRNTTEILEEMVDNQYSSLP